jgi:hypothetical protein
MTVSETMEETARRLERRRERENARNVAPSYPIAVDIPSSDEMAQQNPSAGNK